MKPYLFRYCLLLIAIPLLATQTLGFVHASAAQPTHTAKAVANEEWECIERLFFFGESTTAHLARKGGVLDTPSNLHRVLRDETGTRMLDRRILSSPVFCKDESGNTVKRPFSEAIALIKPECLVLSFGLNGIMGFIRDPARFSDAYTVLIDGILAASPSTCIVLQSVYPVRNAANYSVNVQTLNAHILTLNAQIEQIAASYPNVRFTDTASVLRDSDGSLLAAYDAGDGIHLTNQAYRAILSYLSAALADYIVSERM